MIGHNDIREYLRNAIEHDTLSHAYLFVGPRHIGKTSVATWFAQSMMCEGKNQNTLLGPSEVPCNTCKACRHISEEIHPDVKALRQEEGKQQISIKQIREALSFISQAPSTGDNKITIIEHAHLLSLGAANAFLKTLEEPPASSTIILLTHKPQQLIATIRSRSHPIVFTKPAATDSISNENLYNQLDSRPGLYNALEQDESALSNFNEEVQSFEEMLSMSIGQRLALLEPYFKKSSSHQSSKSDWQQRLWIWLQVLRKKLEESMKTGDHKQASAFKSAIDEVWKLQDILEGSFNLRANIEKVLMVLP